MNPGDAAASLLTLRLAVTTTVLLLAIGVPLAWWLSQSRSWVGRLISGATLLPLVLPPTVVGFYLLVLLGPRGIIGKVIGALHLQITFTFSGLVVGAFCASLPFVVYPIRAGFAAQGRRFMDAAAVLRARPIDVFFSIALPMNKTAIFTGAVLGFAHTIGEFGIMLMIGGAIPGKTQVLSIAIFDHVEAMEYGRAHILALALMFFALGSLLAVHLINRGRDAD